MDNKYFKNKGFENILDMVYSEVDDFVEYMYSNNMYLEYFLKKEVSKENATYDKDVFDYWNDLNSTDYADTDEKFENNTLHLNSDSMYRNFYRYIITRLAYENKDIRDIVNELKESDSCIWDIIYNTILYYAETYFNTNYKSSVFYDNIVSYDEMSDKVIEYWNK